MLKYSPQNKKSHGELALPMACHDSHGAHRRVYDHGQPCERFGKVPTTEMPPRSPGGSTASLFLMSQSVTILVFIIWELRLLKRRF